MAARDQVGQQPVSEPGPELILIGLVFFLASVGMWRFQSRRRTTDKPQSLIEQYTFVALSAVVSLTMILVGLAAWL